LKELKFCSVVFILKMEQDEAVAVAGTLIDDASLAVVNQPETIVDDEQSAGAKLPRVG
jgi:hypothetical protein